MRKTHIRDYATAAFRFYASVGGAALYRQQLWDDAVMSQNRQEGRSGFGSPSEAALMRAEAALEAAAAELDDLEAVERTLAVLRTYEQGASILAAIETVYFPEPSRELQPGEISRRVVQAALKIPAGEATIYRWLALARRIFANERRLRT